MEPTKAKKQKHGLAEKVDGRYTPVPHAVLDSVAFQGAGYREKALLYELIRQHDGKNNGHLQLADSYLRRRGWKSADQANKARKGLIDRRLILCTKLGGLNIGPNRYALTWLPISDFRGLDIQPGTYHKGAWCLMDPLPVPGKAAPEKRDEPSAARSGTAPPRGAAEAFTTPQHGAKTAILGGPATPPHGDNETVASYPAKAKGRRCVARAGASGRKSTPPQLAEAGS